MPYASKTFKINGMTTMAFSVANGEPMDPEDVDWDDMDWSVFAVGDALSLRATIATASTTGDVASTTDDTTPTTDDATPTADDATPTTDDVTPGDMQTMNLAVLQIDDAGSTSDDESSKSDDGDSTTDNIASATSHAPTADPTSFERFYVLDKKGRLLIDVVRRDDDSPHRRVTRRHRVSIDAMERASPAWKNKIFGPEGEERPRPTKDEEDWVVVLEDEPQLAITTQLALIHEKPDTVALWHNNPDTMGVCMFIYEFMVTAEKYGVLPLFRPFVSHWLPHARPSSENADKHYVHRIEAAWQLGALGLVQDHARKLVYDTVLTPPVLARARAKSTLACEDGFLTSLPALFDVVGKRQLELVQSLLDFFHQALADLRGEKGICHQSLPGTPEFERCNAGLNDFVSKRMEEPGTGEIPVEAKDYPRTIHHLLHTTTHVLGLCCDQGPKQLEGHTCVKTFHKKVWHLADELIGRWKGEESILEPEQVEWLKKRGEILATESSPTCGIV